MSMIRRITERLKFHEGKHIKIISGRVFYAASAIDNFLIRCERIPNQPLNKEKRDVIVTASLTSYPARIPYVHLAIKSLLLQSYKPDRIILWLAESQFEDKKLPGELTALQRYGLEIRWCEDICSLKKYYYCVKDQKENEVVITFDDDIIYPVDCIKRLMRKHEEYPHCIVCERAQAITYTEDGNAVLNPGKWKVYSSLGQKPSYSLNPSSGGGCLIPYGAFYKDAQNKEKTYELAYKNDDIWYMFMAAQNGTRTVKTTKYHKTFSIIKNSQVEQLAAQNVIGEKSIEIIKRLIKEYPLAYQRIISDKD